MAKTCRQVFVTTDVLDWGIRKGELESNANSYTEFVRLGGGLVCCREGDWHATYDEALAKAEAVKRCRIATIEEELVELKALTFTNPENTA